MSTTSKIVNFFLPASQNEYSLPKEPFSMFNTNDSVLNFFQCLEKKEKIRLAVFPTKLYSLLKKRLIPVDNTHTQYPNFSVNKGLDYEIEIYNLEENKSYGVHQDQYIKRADVYIISYKVGDNSSIRNLNCTLIKIQRMDEENKKGIFCLGIDSKNVFRDAMAIQNEIKNAKDEMLFIKETLGGHALINKENLADNLDEIVNWFVTGNTPNFSSTCRAPSYS